MARILLAEDEMLCALLLKQWLTEEGHQVRLARDGAHALALEAAWQPDLVVSDVRMPVLDGLEMARRMRQRRPTLPFVFVTGSAQDVERAGLARALLIDKPVSQARFLAAVASFAGRRARGAMAA
jgi:CheY-like chemotaxis protein